MEDLPTVGRQIHNFALLVLQLFISEGLSIWQYVDGSSRRVF